MLHALSLIDATVFIWMVAGVFVGTIITIIPGLGAIFAMVLVIPFLYGQSLQAALGMLVAITAVNGTGNTITAVLFGIPGHPSGVATTLDGHPMAIRGEGMRAISAGLTASAVGGILGAMALAALVPFLQVIVLSFDSPEFFMLTVASLVFMATAGQASTLKGLIAGALGLMLSFVGQEPSTGTPRYTFGILYLSDGFRLVAVFIGIFAIAEILSLLTKGGSIAKQRPAGTAWSQIFQGMRDVWRYRWRVIVSSLTGIVVGIAPGLGTNMSTLLSYALALKTSPNRKYFGQGHPEGVIAADAAHNATDGGALVPTLAFGVPGSPAMAILLAVMISFGIQPGPSMLTNHVDLVWMFIWVLVISNILSAALSFAITPLVARYTFVDIGAIAAPIFVIGLFGAYSASDNLGDMWTAVGFGLVGLAMVKFGYPRSSFVIGLVLGPIVEQNYLLSMRLFGWKFLFRPITFGILCIAVAALLVPPAWKFIQRRRSARSKEEAITAASETKMYGPHPQRVGHSEGGNGHDM